MRTNATPAPVPAPHRGPSAPVRAPGPAIDPNPLRALVSPTTWACAGYVQTGWIIGTVAFSLVPVLVAVGVGVAPVAGLGFLLLVAALYLATWFGDLERARLAASLGEIVEAPAYLPPSATGRSAHSPGRFGRVAYRRDGDGFIGFVARTVKDRARWRAVAYPAALLPVAVVGGTLSAGLAAGGLVGISLPFWASKLPSSATNVFGDMTAASHLVPAVVIGLVALLLAPWVTLLSGRACAGLVRRLLGPSGPDAWTERGAIATAATTGPTGPNGATGPTATTGATATTPATGPSTAAETRPRRRPVAVGLNIALALGAVGYACLTLVAVVSLEHRTFDSSFPVAAVKAVDIHTDDLGVVIAGDARPGQRATVHASLRSSLSHRSYSATIDPDGTLRVHVGCPGWTPAWCGGHITLSVPAGVPVTAHTSDGGVSAQGLSGPLTLSSSDGAVHVADVSGDLRLNSHDGTLRGERVRSPRVTARTSDGRVDLTFLTAPTAVTASSHDGGVAVHVPAASGPYRVEAGTSDGSTRTLVSTDPAGTRTISAHSHDGGVRIDYR